MCNISERYLNDLKFLYERTIDVQLEIMEIDNKLHDFDNEISFHDFDDFFSVQNTSFENFLLMACSSYYGSKLLDLEDSKRVYDSFLNFGDRR